MILTLLKAGVPKVISFQHSCLFLFEKLPVDY